jgi:choline dehydrogenase-like flavoprotein
LLRRFWRVRSRPNVKADDSRDETTGDRAPIDSVARQSYRTGSLDGSKVNNNNAQGGNKMPETFDFVIVGGGSAGAVIAARLSEDPTCRVALIEAGGRPPEVASIPIACGAMQLNPEVDWMYTADPGDKTGHGLNGRRVPVPRGKMLGGSSSINYMMYVRGHPGDFDSWAAAGATGWSYADVLPYFRKSEGLSPSGDIVIDRQAHNESGPLGVSVRSPVLPVAADFVAAAVAAGIPSGDYNGRDRGGAAGVVSLTQHSTRRGKRSSTYNAFLEGDTEQRPNLTIITGAQATRVVLANGSGLTATGVEYRTAAGEIATANAAREVILSAGAIGSPHLLLLSGIGPRRELEAAGVACLLDQPHVGKHLKDHLMVPLYFPAPGAGLSMNEIGLSLGSAALRGPGGPLPADPADDVALPDGARAMRDEADRRLAEWTTTGQGVIASSLTDAVVFCSTGLGDTHSHDTEIIFFATGGDDSLVRSCLNIDTSRYFDDAEKRLAPDAEAVYLLANPVLPRSEGEIVLASADPAVHPAIRMNYYADPHDMKVMVAAVRRALAIAEHWPGNRKVGPVLIPPFLAEKHGHVAGTQPSDALLEDFAAHFSLTVYHHTCTCRIGDVVDPRLRVLGVNRLRVADASVMPNVTSGNTNAPSIMIGEKAAEMIAAEHGVKLVEFVGDQLSNR